jgi:hypothetical protein
MLLAARFLRTDADIPQPKAFRDNFIKPFSESITAACRESTTTFNCLPVAVSMDIWTKHRNSYLGVTLHVVSNDWQRKSISLGLVDFNEAHTSSNLAEKLLSFIESYDETLVDRIVGVTHDSASNNTGQLFVKAIPWRIRICCLAHKASNAAKRLFEHDSDTKRLLRMGKQLSKALMRQHPWQAMLRVSKEAKVIPRFSDTRFNGGYAVFQSLLHQRKIIDEAIDYLEEHVPDSFKKLQAKNCVFDRNDWGLVAQLVRSLYPVHNFIIELQRSTTTLSDALMQYRVLLQLLRPSEALPQSTFQFSFGSTFKHTLRGLMTLCLFFQLRLRWIPELERILLPSPLGRKFQRIFK